MSSDSTHTTSPTAESMFCTLARCSGATWSLATNPVIPFSTSAGVLGMARTTRGQGADVEPNQCDKVVKEMPAAILKTRFCAVRCGLHCRVTSANCCGLTASTQIEWRASSAVGSLATVKPRSRQRARVSPLTSITCRCSGDTPRFSSPSIRAPAMLPPPINAMSIGLVMGVKFTLFTGSVAVGALCQQILGGNACKHRCTKPIVVAKCPEAGSTIALTDPTNVGDG